MVQFLQAKCHQLQAILHLLRFICHRDQIPVDIELKKHKIGQNKPNKVAKKHKIGQNKPNKVARKHKIGLNKPNKVAKKHKIGLNKLNIYRKSSDLS